MQQLESPTVAVAAVLTIASPATPQTPEQSTIIAWGQTQMMGQATNLLMRRPPTNQNK